MSFWSPHKLIVLLLFGGNNEPISHKARVLHSENLDTFQNIADLLLDSPEFIAEQSHVPQKYNRSGDYSVQILWDRTFSQKIKPIADQC